MCYSLVSVCLITYNSAAYIVESLNSIYSQTYYNIELVISDDASQDNTTQIIESWLKIHKNRFRNVVFLTSNSNTGTSANCNRAYKAASGEWIKMLAGDDILFSDSIENFMMFVNFNKDADIIVSKVRIFPSIFSSKYRCIFLYGYFYLSRKVFNEAILLDNFLPMPSSFIRSRVLHEMGGFIESIPLLEDWPFWIRATKLSYNIIFYNNYTVSYRVSESSISSINNHSLFYEKSFNSAKSYALECQFSNRALWKLGSILYKIPENKLDSIYIFVQKLFTPYFYRYFFYRLVARIITRMI